MRSPRDKNMAYNEGEYCIRKVQWRNEWHINQRPALLPPGRFTTGQYPELNILGIFIEKCQHYSQEYKATFHHIFDRKGECKMQSEIVVLHNYKVHTEKDTLEVGFFKPESDDRSVAYASLGNTTVAISRSTDGKVRIEIDDTAEESVYVSINALAIAIAIEDDGGSEKPWNAKMTSQE